MPIAHRIRTRYGDAQAQDQGLAQFDVRLVRESGEWRAHAKADHEFLARKKSGEKEIYETEDLNGHLMPSPRRRSEPPYIIGGALDLSNTFLSRHPRFFSFSAAPVSFPRARTFDNLVRREFGQNLLP